MVNTIHAKTHRQMLLCAPGITDPYFTGIKKITDPKTNLKHDCFIEFVNITVYEIFFCLVKRSQDVCRILPVIVILWRKPI